jgi:hypothetical protein
LYGYPGEVNTPTFSLSLSSVAGQTSGEFFGGGFVTVSENISSMAKSNSHKRGVSSEKCADQPVAVLSRLVVKSSSM